MEDYKMRFILEYHNLKENYEKLRWMLLKWKITADKNKADPDKLSSDQKKECLGFVPTCSYALLERQLCAMEDYLSCLEERSIYEKVDLTSKLKDDGD